MSDVSQGPGWWQAADSKWYPPEQHPDYVAPPPPNVPPPHGPQYAAAGGSGIAFDAREITPGGLIVLVGGLLYCVFAFFPWYVQDIDCGIAPPGVPCAISFNAWHSGTALLSAVLFLLAAGVFLAKALKVIPAPKVPLELAALGAVALGDLFFLIAFVSFPAGLFGFARGWGLWLDLVVVIAINVGAVLQFLRKGRAQPAV